MKYGSHGKMRGSKSHKAIETGLKPGVTPSKVGNVSRGVGMNKGTRHATGTQDTIAHRRVSKGPYTPT